MDRFPWCFSAEHAPKDRMIIAAFQTKSGAHVCKTRWLPPQADRPNGRWEFMNEGQHPYAWLSWPDAPDFPEFTEWVA